MCVPVCHVKDDIAATAKATSVVSDSVWPCGWQPTRLLRPWDFPGKSTGVGCHCLLLRMILAYSIIGDLNFHLLVKGVSNRFLHHRVTLHSVQFSSVQSRLTLCYPMNRTTPGLPVHHQLPEFTQTHVHGVGDTIQPSHPLSSPSPPAFNPSQHQGLF